MDHRNGLQFFFRKAYISSVLWIGNDIKFVFESYELSKWTGNFINVKIEETIFF